MLWDALEAALLLTKLHAIVTTGGQVLKIVLTPGQRHGGIKAKELLQAARGKAPLGDTASDSNEFIDAIRDKGMKAELHPHPRRVWHMLKLDRRKYYRWYLVEVLFHTSNDVARSRPATTKGRAATSALSTSLAFFSASNKGP